MKVWDAKHKLCAFAAGLSEAERTAWHRQELRDLQGSRELGLSLEQYRFREENKGLIDQQLRDRLKNWIHVNTGVSAWTLF